MKNKKKLESKFTDIIISNKFIKNDSCLLTCLDIFAFLNRNVEYNK